MYSRTALVLINQAGKPKTGLRSWVSMGDLLRRYIAVQHISLFPVCI